MNKEKIKQIFTIVAIIFCIVVFITCLLLKIWVMIEYGNLPLSEVPAWALPWLLNN